MEFGRCLQRMATCTRDAWRRDGFPTRRARADNPRMGNRKSVANRGSGQTQQVGKTAVASCAKEARASRPGNVESGLATVFFVDSLLYTALPLPGSFELVSGT